ncbi:MAG: ABC transporter substrate-binding protein, partial [Pseudomonadota bacterium]|nr:ABC transporter substrate-binding protein [Pseudomonadota bacterium]
MRGLYLISFLVFYLFWVTSTQADSFVAKRIVTLAPNIAQLVIDAGAGNRLVGVTAWTNLPATIHALPIGDSEHINLEQILSLKPDLILAWQGGTPPYVIHQLHKLGLNVVTLDTATLEDIGPALIKIGQLAHTLAQAQQVASNFNNELHQLHHQGKLQAPLSVFIDIWDSPLMTINGTNFMSEAASICNAHNIYAHNKLLTPLVSLESLITLNPDVIITFSDQSRSIWIKRHFPRAARKKQIIILNASKFTQATPAILGQIKLFCH